MFAILAAPLLALLAESPLDDADEQYRFLQGLHEKGLHELVVEEARAFLEEHEGHAKRDFARYRLAFALFELDRHEEARRELSTLSRLRGFTFEPEVCFRLGQCELELGRTAAAATAFERVVELETDYLLDSALFLLGEARFRAEDFAAADEAYARVSEGEHARDARYGGAWCAYRLGDLAASAKRIGSFLERWPRDPARDELHQLLGEVEMAAGRPRRALAAYESVGPGPLRDAALHGAGFANVELGDHLAAARSFATLLDEAPESRFASEAALHLGISLYEVEQFESALVALNLPQSRESGEHAYWTARVRVELGQLEEALDDLQRAGAKRPDEELASRVHTLRGDVLLRLGRTEEASRAYDAAGSEYAAHAAVIARLEEGAYREAADLGERFARSFPSSEFASATQLARAEAHFGLGELDRAEELFRGLTERGDSSLGTRALHRAAWCAYLRGETTRASEDFRRSARSHPDPELRAEALYMQGRALEAAGESVRAAQRLEEYVAEHPRGPFGSAALLTLAGLEPLEGGLPHLERLLAEFPGTPEAEAARFELAERLSQLERHEEALEHYERLLAEFPGSDRCSSARYGAAWSAFSLGEYGAARAWLEEVGAAEGEDSELELAALELRLFTADRLDDADGAAGAWRALKARCRDEARLSDAARVVAGTLERAGRRKAAKRVLAEAIERIETPETLVAARVERVWLALADADLGGAEADLREALRVGVDTPAVREAAFFVGEAWFDAGEKARAAALYELALSPRSRVADRAHYKRGYAQLELGDTAAAAASFRRVVEEHPSSELYGESLFLQGESEFRRGRWSAACESLERLLRELPEHAVAPKALFRLGVARCHLEEWSKAERALADLVRRFPEFEQGVEAELWRGRALAARGDLRGARQALRRVLSRDDGLLAARARLELGRVSLAEDDHEEALSEFLKVALLYANEEEVAEALLLAGHCLELAGDAERARAQYRELLEKYPNTSSAPEARRRLGG